MNVILIYFALYMRQIYDIVHIIIILVRKKYKNVFFLLTVRYFCGKLEGG